MNSSKLFPAISIAALALAGASIILSQSSGPIATPEMRSVPTVDTSDLEQRLSSLTAEVIALRAELDALQDARPDAEGSPEAAVAALARGEAIPEALEGRIAEAVDDVMARRQAEQRAKKLEGQRAGMAKWVDARLDQLPTLYDRISENMSLPAGTQREVEDIIAATFDEVAVLTDQLMADPPPGEQAAYEIMGEVKQTVGGMVGQLDEILTADELIQLGQATVDSEMPRIGYAIMEEGKEDYDEEAAGEGEANTP